MQPKGTNKPMGLFFTPSLGKNFRIKVYTRDRHHCAITHGFHTLNKNKFSYPYFTSFPTNFNVFFKRKKYFLRVFAVSIWCTDHDGSNKRALSVDVINSKQGMSSFFFFFTHDSFFLNTI